LAQRQLGDARQAEASFRKVIELSPQSTQGYNNLGSLLSEQGHPVEAQEFFRQALRIEPQNPAALLGLGTTLAATKMYSQAVAYLDRAWRGEPGFQAGYELARVLRELKRPAEAQRILAKLTSPTDPALAAKFFVLSAVLAEDQKDPAAAGSLYRRAYELAPGSFEIYLSLARVWLENGGASSGKPLPEASHSFSPEQHFTLGLLFASRGSYLQAVPHFEETLKQEPSSYATAYNLALAYKNSGNSQAAIKLVEATLAKKPTAELHSLLASLQETAGNYLEAVRHFQKAVELEPTNEQYYFDLGLEYLAHFTFAPALEAFDVGTRKFPSAARQHEGQGLVYYALRRYSEAANAFLTALEINISSPSAFAAWNAIQPLLSPAEVEGLLPRLQHLSELQPQVAEARYCYGVALLTQALALNRLEKLDSAQMLLELAIRLKPKMAEAHLALGNLYVARKENQKAAEAFLETIRLDPRSEMAFYRLGQTYRNLNQLEQAQQQLSRYEELVRDRREQMARSRSAIKQFVVAQSGKESR
jgi:tetratricopeptide (TPR) repeat protein